MQLVKTDSLALDALDLFSLTEIQEKFPFAFSIYQKLKDKEKKEVNPSKPVW